MFMTTGALGGIFLGLGVLLGTVAPMLVMLAPFGHRQGGLRFAALLVLVGGMALRYSILVGGQIVQTYY